MRPSRIAVEIAYALTIVLDLHMLGVACVIVSVVSLVSVVFSRRQRRDRWDDIRRGSR